MPEMSHLVVCRFGRPAFRFRLSPYRTGGGRVFAPGWWQRGRGGAGCGLVALQSGLEEPRDPLEGRGRLGGRRALVDLARMLTHVGGDDGVDGGWW